MHVEWVLNYYHIFSPLARNLVYIFCFLIGLQFFACQSPDDFGDLGYFSLDDPAYDIAFDVHAKIPVINRSNILPQDGVAKVFYGDNHFVMLTQQDSIICFNLPDQEVKWAIRIPQSYWPSCAAKINNGKFILAHNRSNEISHYVLELSTGNILKSSSFGYPEGYGIAELQFNNEDLILLAGDEVDFNHRRLALYTWNWTTETYLNLFTTHIKEPLSINPKYLQMQMDNGKAYIVYHYDVDSKERSTNLYKYDLTADTLDSWNVKGENLYPTYFGQPIASVSEGLFVYASNDTLYAFDTESETYSFIKNPLKGIEIETLKIENGYLIVKYPQENHIIDLQTGKILLKPDRYFNLLLHPSKELYFDRPVGDLSTLAIRDLASGQMLCEAEFGFVPSGLDLLFYDNMSDQIIFIQNRFLFLMHMPEEL